MICIVFLQSIQQPGPSNINDNFLPEPILKLTSTADQSYSPRYSPTTVTSSNKHGKPVMIPAELQTQAKVVPKAVDILVIGGFQTDGGKH